MSESTDELPHGQKIGDGSRLAAALAWARRNGPHTIAEIGLNFAAPAIVFALAKKPLGDVDALLAASAPPIAWSIVQFVRRRRIDAVSMLALAGIALSLLAFLGGGGVKFLQLRERLVTVAIGLAFLGSAAIGRPLIFHLARATMRARSPTEAARFDAMRDNPRFRHSMTVMTVVWGVGLLAEAAISVVLVFTLSIQRYLIVSPLVGYTTAGALTLWTFLYARSRMRRGRAAEAARIAAIGSPLSISAEEPVGGERHDLG
jgi:hypothetical protein